MDHLKSLHYFPPVFQLIKKTKLQRENWNKPQENSIVKETHHPQEHRKVVEQLPGNSINWYKQWIKLTTIHQKHSVYTLLEQNYILRRHLITQNDLCHSKCTPIKCSIGSYHQNATKKNCPCSIDQGVIALCDILLCYLNEALMKARFFSLISAAKPMTILCSNILYGCI